MEGDLTRRKCGKRNRLYLRENIRGLPLDPPHIGIANFIVQILRVMMGFRILEARSFKRVSGAGPNQISLKESGNNLDRETSSLPRADRKKL